MTVDPLVVSTANDIFGDLTAAGADPATAWAALRESGLPWLGIDEAAGGEGGSPADAAAVIAVGARHAVVVPFAENWIAASLLANAGLQVPRDPDAGPLTVGAAAAGATLSSNTLTARLPRVPFADTAAGVVTVVEGSVLLVAPGAVTAGRSLSGEARGAVELSAVTPVQVGTATGPDLVTTGALVRSVQLAAAMSRVLTMTTTYAGQRTQFGKPIAKFQAVAHLIAQLAEHVASAQMAADIAVSGAARGDWTQVAIAKSVCGSAAGVAARYAHQVHGAIGVTVEYELQTFTRRLFTWRDDFDTERVWDTLVGEHVATLDGTGLWQLVIGEAPATARG